MPTATTLTEAAFEALENADGVIADTYCGVIVITATNGANPGCSGNAVRTYTITEYDDINNNNIHEANETTVLNSTTCTQIFRIQDTTAPLLTTTFDRVVQAVCNAIPVAPVLSFTDNCTDVSAITVNLAEVISTVSPNGAYRIVRTWIASDLCGNLTTASQTVNVTIPDYFRTTTIDAQCNIDVNLTVDVAAIISNQFSGIIRQGGRFIGISGAGSALTSSGIFTPLNLADGNYIVRYENNDTNCPRIIEVTIPVNTSPACTIDNCVPITVHNAISPNGDGLNEALIIDNVTNACYKENTIEIYNRWGIQVYGATNYNNEDVVFKGYSEGRDIAKQSSTLPTGTYFYVFKFKSINGNYVSKTGWLYLSGAN